MAQVRMRHHISGGRQVDLENHTFAEWPEAGGILECGEEEAADLIRGGMADPVILPVPAATPAAAVRTEPAADEETPERPAPVRTRTEPRVRTVKP